MDLGRSRASFSSELSPPSWIWPARANRACFCSALGQVSSEAFHIRLMRRRWHFRKGRHQCGDAWNDLQQSSGLRTGKARIDNMIEKGKQGRPVAADVDEQDRLVVQPKLLPADDLEHLVEGSDAARQERKGIRLLGHQPL